MGGAILQSEKSDNAQIMAILALIIAGLLAVATLGIDVLDLYWNKNRLQAGVDAAALAGASYFGNVVFTAADPRCNSYSGNPQLAACTFALRNGIALAEIQGITVNNATFTVTITAQRKIAAIFAKVVGIHEFTVGASATAALQALNSATGILPIGLDSTTPYVYGQSITIHDSGCGPGCWQGLALQSASYGNTGGAAFQQNLSQGCACTLTVGDIVTSETGAKVGPIIAGVAALVAAGDASDPSGTFDSHTPSDARAALLVLTDWNGCNGSCSVPVIGFAAVWVVSASGSSINVVFIQQVELGTGGGTPSIDGAYHAALIQ
jgi:putative Flp pilus-assembly TadE/G-like protein